ncbi:MAG: hypothetical protein ACK5B9_16425 [Flavobacteriia bacterium]|jgi:hypothetical protein
MKQFIIFCSLFVGFQIHSQFDFSLRLGAGVGISKSKTFNMVQDSYNTFNASTLKNNLSTGLNKALTIELNAKSDRLFMGLGLTSFRASANAKFTNDSERIIDFKHNFYNILIGFSKDKGDGEIVIASGICVTDYFLTSYVEYATGDRDYAYGTLQGTYHTNGFGIPMMLEYGRYLDEDLRYFVYGRCQIQAISATKFTLYNIANGQTSAIYEGVEILDDTKRMLFEIGLKYNL